MTGDDSRVRHVIDEVVESIRTRDLDRLRRLYTPDVVSFDIDPPLRHAGVDAKLANWERVFTFFTKPDYEVRDLTLHVDENVAFGHCFGRLSGTLANGATTDGMWVRATFGFRRIDGGWLIAHDQVSVPLDIASGNGVTDLTPY
jgi:ketosteroid isomerase-like protein